MDCLPFRIIRGGPVTHQRRNAVKYYFTLVQFRIIHYTLRSSQSINKATTTNNYDSISSYKFFKKLQEAPLNTLSNLVAISSLRSINYPDFAQCIIERIEANKVSLGIIALKVTKGRIHFSTTLNQAPV